MINISKNIMRIKLEQFKDLQKDIIQPENLFHTYNAILKKE